MSREKLMCKVFKHDAGKVARLADGTMYGCHEKGNFIKYRSDVEQVEKMVRHQLHRLKAQVRNVRVTKISAQDEKPPRFMVEVGRVMHLPAGGLLGLLQMLPVNCGTARVIREIERPQDRWPQPKAKEDVGSQESEIKNTEEPTEQTGAIQNE